ncbi:MAG: hypothetical protein Q8R14_02705 [Candidatus Omnitrophota bacterium]|nr:hypothetical protein [Candidatus Omnitrophota bacterium]
MIKRIKRAEKDVKDGKVKSFDRIEKELGRNSYLKMTRFAINEITYDLRDKELLKAVAEGRQAIRKGATGISFKADMRKCKG